MISFTISFALDSVLWPSSHCRYCTWGSPSWTAVCPPLHLLPFVSANNNDIQLALSNYLFTQRGRMLVRNTHACTSVCVCVCVCVCVWWEWENLTLIWNLFTCFSFPMAALLICSRLQCLCVFLLLREEGWGFSNGTSMGARTGTAVYLCTHTHTHSHMCLPIDHYQLFLPSGPGKVAVPLRCSEAAISTNTHMHACNKSGQGVDSRLCVRVCTQPPGLRALTSSLHQLLSTL